MNTIKDEAIKLIRNMPEDISWDDLMYEFYVRQKIEAGLKATAEGKTISHEAIKKKFLHK